MALGNPPAGPSAPAFQISGVPFATATIIANNSTVKVSFPYVTRDFRISSSVPIRLGFTENGVAGTNYFGIVGDSGPITIRTPEIYLRSVSGLVTASVLAGLSPVTVVGYNFVTSSTNLTGSKYFVYDGVG